MKQVIYNGGTESFYPCSKPTELEVGHVYEVVSEIIGDFHSEYKLKGIKGVFNSCWFNEMSDFPATYFAISHSLPVVGQRYNCYKLDLNTSSMVGWLTSTVQSVTAIGRNTYKVLTRNSIYLVKVI